MDLPEVYPAISRTQILTCLYCQCAVTLPWSKRARKFCSDGCSYLFHKALVKRPSVTITCEHCGTTSTVVNKGGYRRFCGEVCRTAYHASHRPPSPKILWTCVQCGVEFEGIAGTKNGDVRFCSKRCCSKYHQRKSAQPITCQCRHCGKDFETYASRHKRTFCSDACADANKALPTPPKPVRTITCQGCGVEVRLRYNSEARKFCSIECRALHSTSKTKPRVRGSIACAWCGTEFIAALRNGKRKHCSKECNTKAGIATAEARRREQNKDKPPRNYDYMRGAKCHLWKGGVTPANKTARHSPEYRAWRLTILQRDWFRCQRCGVTSKTIKTNGTGERRGNLVAHHIKPWRDFPDLRFDVSNGITYCRDCHNQVDDYIRWNKRRTGIKWSEEERQQRMQGRQRRAPGRHLSVDSTAPSQLTLGL